MGAFSDWMVVSTPGLLAGLAALAIPVVIHLISRSRGRRVLIGNIRLVRTARRKLVHQLRITQWPLLILRMLLLGVTAFMLGGLAAPGLDQRNGDAVYVTPAWLAASGEAERAELASAAPDARVLAPGFPNPADFRPSDLAPRYDLWPVLAERLSLVHHTGTVHVYTTGRYREFGALEPPLPGTVAWHVTDAEVPPPDRPALKVLMIQGAEPDARSLAIERALRSIARNRLPGLEWRSIRWSGQADLTAIDAVIWTGPEKVPNARPEIAAATRWIDLNDTAWNNAWQAADFPQRMLDVLLSPAQLDRAWSAAPVSPGPGNTARAGPAIREQLPRSALQQPLALILILLWGLERWMSERRTDERI